MKLKDFLDNIYEAIIVGNQQERTKEYTIQSLRNVVGRYESRNNELVNEIIKNKNILEDKILSIFKTLDSMITNLPTPEQKEIGGDVFNFLTKTYKKDTVQDIMEILKRK